MISSEMMQADKARMPWYRVGWGPLGMAFCLLDMIRLPFGS